MEVGKSLSGTCVSCSVNTNSVSGLLGSTLPKIVLSCAVLASVWSSKGVCVCVCVCVQVHCLCIKPPLLPLILHDSHVAWQIESQ